MMKARVLGHDRVGGGEGEGQGCERCAVVRDLNADGGGVRMDAAKEGRWRKSVACFEWRSGGNERGEGSGQMREVSGWCFARDLYKFTALYSTVAKSDKMRNCGNWAA